MELTELIKYHRYIQPGVIHAVLTVSEVDADFNPMSPGSILLGAHLYCLTTMRHTMNARWRHSRWSGIVTNADKPEAESLLHRIAFWVYEMKKNIFTSLEDLQTAHNQKIVSYRFPHDGVLCLIFQIISAEEFELRPQDDSPPIVWPASFLLQRNNAAAIMSDLLTMIREKGGELWEMWLALCAEMNDRAIYDDDVNSHTRRLIRHAQALKPQTNRPNVFDIRYIHFRQGYFDTPLHPTGHDDPPAPGADGRSTTSKVKRRKKGKNVEVKHGPQELPPWSFLGEGGYMVDAVKGIARFPGRIQANLWEEWSVLSGKRGVLGEAPDFGAPPGHPEIETLEEEFEEIRRTLEATGKDWATQLELGNMESKGNWVGFYEDFLDNIDAD